MSQFSKTRTIKDSGAKLQHLNYSYYRGHLGQAEVFDVSYYRGRLGQAEVFDVSYYRGRLGQAEVFDFSYYRRHRCQAESLDSSSSHKVAPRSDAIAAYLYRLSPTFAACA